MDLTTPFATMSGSTAVVTGAARGIGLAITQTLCDVGMTVVMIDRDAEELERTVSCLNDEHKVLGVATSLSLPDCREPIERALADLAPVTVWVNNAGRVSHQDARDVDLDLFEEVMRDNASSALRGSQIAFDAMTAGAEPGGAIVNITSLVTEKALPQRLSYSTSKAALENITRYCAQEWGSRGVRVNAVSPGYIDTRLTQWADDDPRAAAKRSTLAGLALPRAGSTDEIANTVLYLASPLASYVTGQTVFVDGGWHLT